MQDPRPETGSGSGSGHAPAAPAYHRVVRLRRHSCTPATPYVPPRGGGAVSLQGRFFGSRFYLLLDHFQRAQEAAEKDDNAAIAEYADKLDMLLRYAIARYHPHNGEGVETGGGALVPRAERLVAYFHADGYDARDVLRNAHIACMLLQAADPDAAVQLTYRHPSGAGITAPIHVPFQASTAAADDAADTTLVGVEDSNDKSTGHSNDDDETFSFEGDLGHTEMPLVVVTALAQQVEAECGGRALLLSVDPPADEFCGVLSAAAFAATMKLAAELTQMQAAAAATGDMSERERGQIARLLRVLTPWEVNSGAVCDPRFELRDAPPGRAHAYETDTLALVKLAACAAADVGSAPFLAAPALLLDTASPRTPATPLPEFLSIGPAPAPAAVFDDAAAAHGDAEYLQLLPAVMQGCTGLPFGRVASIKSHWFGRHPARHLFARGDANSNAIFEGAFIATTAMRRFAEICVGPVSIDSVVLEGPYYGESGAVLLVAAATTANMRASVLACGIYAGSTDTGSSYTAFAERLRDVYGTLFSHRRTAFMTTGAPAIDRALRDVFPGHTRLVSYTALLAQLPADANPAHKAEAAARLHALQTLVDPAAAAAELRRLRELFPTLAPAFSRASWAHTPANTPRHHQGTHAAAAAVLAELAATGVLARNPQRVLLGAARLQLAVVGCEWATGFRAQMAVRFCGDSVYLAPGVGGNLRCALLFADMYTAEHMPGPADAQHRFRVALDPRSLLARWLRAGRRPHELPPLARSALRPFHFADSAVRNARLDAAYSLLAVDVNMVPSAAGSWGPGTCTCSLFQHNGYPCVHALRVALSFYAGRIAPFCAPAARMRDCLAAFRGVAAVALDFSAADVYAARQMAADVVVGQGIADGSGGGSVCAGDAGAEARDRRKRRRAAAAAARERESNGGAGADDEDEEYVPGAQDKRIRV